MGSVDNSLATALRDRLALERAVETGTYLGATARKLAKVFPEVVTIELSEALHRDASEALADVPRVRTLQGHSVEHLGEVARSGGPALYFLDGHWSGGATEGVEDPCPVLAELEAIGDGHPDDCFIIDDAQLFASSPPPPHDASAWPSLVEVFDALRERHGNHIVTLLDDQVVAVPARAKPALDAYGHRLQARIDVGRHLSAARVRLAAALRQAGRRRGAGRHPA